MKGLLQSVGLARAILPSGGYSKFRMATHHPLNHALLHSFPFSKNSGNVVIGNKTADVAYNTVLDWTSRGIRTTSGFGPKIQNKENIVAANFSVRLVFIIEEISADEHVLIDKDHELYVKFNGSGDIDEIIIGGVSSLGLGLNTNFVKDTTYDLIISRNDSNLVEVFLNASLIGSFTNSGVVAYGRDLGVGTSLTHEDVAHLRGTVLLFEAWTRSTTAERAVSTTFTSYAKRLERLLPYTRKNPEDSITFAETIALDIDYRIIVTDNVSFTETILPGIDVALQIRDTIFVKEYTLAGANLSLGTSDIIKFSERSGKIFNISASDTFGLTENPLKRELVTDSVTFGEAALPVVSKRVIDTIVFSEIGTVIYTRNISVVDSITFLGGISGYAIIDNQYAPSIGGTD